MATIPEIISRWVDNDGAPLPFSRLYSYAAHSSVPKQLFADIDCTIPLSNPLVSDASGKFGQFFATSGRYKFALHSQTDDLIDTRDDIEASGNGSVGTVTSVQVTLGAALGAAQHVTTPPVTSAGNINMEFLPQSSRYVLIGPAGSTGLPTFRALEAADIPDLSGRYLPLAGGTMNEVPSGGADVAVVFPSVDDGFSQISHRSVVFTRGSDYANLQSSELWMTGVNSGVESCESYTKANLHSIKVTETGSSPTNILRSITSDVSGTHPTITVSGSLGVATIDDTWFSMRDVGTTLVSQLSNNSLTFDGTDPNYGASYGGSGMSINGAGASNCSFNSLSTCFVGQDFDIRNGKRLLIGGAEAISSARVGSFTGFSSTGGGTITGGKLELAASTTTYSCMSFAEGVAPTTPGTCDIWRYDNILWLNGKLTTLSGIDVRSSVPYGTTAYTSPFGITFGDFQYAVDPDQPFRAYLQMQKLSGSTARAAFVIGFRGASNNAVYQDPMYFFKDLMQTNVPLSVASSSGVSTIGGYTAGKGASDSVGVGSYIQLNDSNTATTKSWMTQLGASNTLDFHRFSGSWSRAIQFSAAGGIGFYGAAAPSSRPAVTGSRGGNAALASLLTQLAACGIIADSTTA